MFRLLSLLIPALIPSWAFFKAIEPSPRVHWRLLERPDGKATPWHPYRERAQRVSPLAMVYRLFWNPRWNQTLYMVSLAERLTIDPTAHSTSEINRLLAAEVTGDAGLYLQFQLVFVTQEDGGRVQSILHLSEPCLLSEASA